MSLTVVHKDKSFNIGDTVCVWQTIKEQTAKGGERTRLQAFEGIVIASRGHGDNKSFTVRRMATGGIGVERIFPVNSPLIDRVDLTNRGIVRRSKLYYLREKTSREVAEVAKRFTRLKAAQASSVKKSSSK
ncbi:MAG: 50S ribosomal protein L19 [Candidatus Blackburnbacteria bacterium]|nr:50S ribosomal protein L19 [Candidatus Blackburnbacteria bacterium]